MGFLAGMFDGNLRFLQQYARALLARERFEPLPGGGQIDLESQFVAVRGLRVALARERKLVITGAPGSGKTSALTHLALMHARGLVNDPGSARFPVLLRARDWNANALPRPEDAIMLLIPSAAREYLRQLIASDRALILIDDLDTFTEPARTDWLLQFGGAQVVASARAGLPGLTEFTLPGFRDNDIYEFVEMRVGKPKRDAFTAALKASGVPRSLTSNPQTLTLLAQLWQSDAYAPAVTGEIFQSHGIKQLPNLRADLFSAYAQIALREDDPSTGRRREPVEPSGQADTARMLEGVALAIQRGRPAPAEFLAKSRGFLIAGKNQTADFVHDLWRSYFAARALRHAPDSAALTEHLDDPNWFDVILFYAGLGDAKPLIDVYTARHDPVMAGFVIAHAKEFSKEAREAVTSELVERAWKGDARAIAALSEMRNEIAVDNLAARLKEKDPAVRTRAVEILGDLKLDRGIEYLLPQLRDVNKSVRDKVVEALGKSRTDRVVEPLLVALRGDPRVGTIDTQLRIAAARALGQVAHEKAFAALIVDLQMGEPEVRAVAAEALKQIKSPLMYKPLKSILQTGDPLARRYAEEVLAVVDGARAD